jgi:hypothetical protein
VARDSKRPAATQDEYDKKARDLKQRQTEIGLRIARHEKGDGDFRVTLESLISLASRAGELFERSKIEQKRQLISFVFSNLRLRGKKLEFSLRSPFDLMVNRATYASWPAKDLADPFGTIIIKKGDVRTGGSYWTRYSKIAVWNSVMDENDYLTKRWTEFLNA